MTYLNLDTTNFQTELIPI